MCICVTFTLQTASTGLMILRTIFGFFNAEKLKQKLKTAFGAL